MVGAELEPGVLSAGSSSFIVVDFFDFESQATPLLPGTSPAFDFATTFKVMKKKQFHTYWLVRGGQIMISTAAVARLRRSFRSYLAVVGGCAAGSV